jgi:hypothetical protein
MDFVVLDGVVFVNVTTEGHKSSGGLWTWLLDFTNIVNIIMVEIAAAVAVCPPCLSVMTRTIPVSRILQPLLFIVRIGAEFRSERCENHAITVQCCNRRTKSL